MSHEFPIDEFDQAQVLAALQPWREWLPGQPMSRQHPRSNANINGVEHQLELLPGVERMCNIRFDCEYELRDKDEIAVLSTEAVKHLLDSVAVELTDVLTYGDWESRDVLLKAFNGTRKRGYHAKQLQIPMLSLYQEFKPTKGTLEYTLYTVPFIEWDKPE